MPTYLITYHGGEGMPATPEARQQVLEAFGAWASGIGDAMLDPGAPLAGSRTVSARGVTEEPAAGAASGYTLVQAGNLDAAVELVTSHPFLTRGGSLQVSEAVDLGA
jgi:hypothetical protein